MITNRITKTSSTDTNQAKSIAQPAPIALNLSNSLTILGAAALGAFLVLATNFSYMNIAHNAGHDTRHSIGFPCH